MAVIIFRLFYCVLILLFVSTVVVLAAKTSVVSALVKPEALSASHNLEGLVEEDDIILRTLAYDQIKSCAPKDTECKAYRLFRYVSSVSGASSGSFDQALERSGVLLFSSLLANIDVKHKLIMADGAFYPAVCGLSEDKIYDYLQKDASVRTAFSDSVRLAKGKIWFFVPPVEERGEHIEIYLDAASDVSLYIFATKNNMDIHDGLSYFHECTQRGAGGIQQSCFLQQGNVIAVYAPESDTAFKIRVDKMFSAEDNIFVKQYGQERCVVFNLGSNGISQQDLPDRKISVLDID